MPTHVTVLDRFCTEVGRGTIIKNPEVERQLLKLYLENGSQEARDILVKSCLRFVVKLAHRYARGDIERLTELVAAGNEGLLIAIDRFDTRRTTRLLTYAASWIRLHIRQELQRGSTVAIPVWHQNAKRQLRKAQQTSAAKTGKKPPLKKLCKETGYSEGRVEKLLTENIRVTSLDATALSGASLLDVLETNAEGADETIRRNEQKRLVQKILGALPEQERTVLTMYFGLGDEDPMTSQQIGDLMGVSRERARQIQQRARSRFKKKLRNLFTDGERSALDQQSNTPDAVFCASLI